MGHRRINGPSQSPPPLLTFQPLPASPRRSHCSKGTLFTPCVTYAPPMRERDPYNSVSIPVFPVPRYGIDRSTRAGVASDVLSTISPSHPSRILRRTFPRVLCSRVKRNSFPVKIRWEKRDSCFCEARVYVCVCVCVCVGNIEIIPPSFLDRVTVKNVEFVRTRRSLLARGCLCHPLPRVSTIFHPVDG